MKGIALAALASVLLYGSALAVPSPSNPSFHPGSDAALTSATPAAAHSATGARILFRTSDRLLARGTFRSGGGSLAGNVASIGTGSSRSKAHYMLSGMVLAALTPLALHHSGEPGDKSVSVQTQTPASSSLASLGDAISTGHGHGHGRGGGNGGGGGDDEGDCNNNDNGGDNGDDDGGVVCDTGDHGDNDDNGDNGGDCDNGGGCDNGGNCSGGDQGGGGGNGGGGGGTSLPEPGTVPLVGAGLMMALAFRSRRDR